MGKKPAIAQDEGGLNLTGRDRKASAGESVWSTRPFLRKKGGGGNSLDQRLLGGRAHARFQKESSIGEIGKRKRERLFDAWGESSGDGGDLTRRDHSLL